MAAEASVVLYDGQAKPRLIPSYRFTLALLVFFAFIVQYSQRVNLPITIVCIVNRTKPIGNESLLQTGNGLLNTNSKNTLKTTILNNSNSKSFEKWGILNEKQFFWSEFQQQLLLGGYWTGYIFTQIPGGWLATSMGAKWVYACSLGLSSIANLALVAIYKMPDTHFILPFVLRLLTGLAHGVLFPATASLWAVWAVPHERSTLASIGFCGTHLGTSLTMLVGGQLCRYFNAGWTYLFLITSILGFIWLILWILFTANTPHDHKSISNHERDYIISYTGSKGKRRFVPITSLPWKNILKSKAVNALVITHIANLFGLFFFLTNLAKILKELFKYSSETTGYILAFGYILMLFSSLLSGIITDRLVQAKLVTLTNARRFFNSLTSFVPVLCMISLCFCDHSQRLVGSITVLIYLTASGLAYGSGFVVNFTDVAPAYSGVIFGLANTLVSIASVTANMVAGFIIKDAVLEQWRKLYIMFGIVYFIGGIVYLIYGSAEPRKWATFEAANKDVKKQTVNEEEAIPMTEKT